MATLSISLRTEYLPSQINNVDILIAELHDLEKSQFRIMTDFPDRLNLREGVVLTKFGGLEQGTDYTYIIRVYINQAPYIVHQNVIVRLRDEHMETSVVIRTV